MKKRAGVGKAKGYFLLFLVAVILSIPIFSGWLSDFWSGITGAGTSETTTVSVTINTNQTIMNLTNTSPVTITEGGSVLAFFSFIVFDPDGFGDVNNNTARIRVNITTAGVDSGVTTGGFADRTNSTCASVGTGLGRLNDTAIRYNCSVSMWYWDTPGNWTVNASIRAVNGVMVQNHTSRSFELYQTTSMVMAPNALTWGSSGTLLAGDTNQTSNADPIIINNTGNKNVSSGNITVAGYDLQGLTTTTHFINAQNFSVGGKNGTTDCTGVNCFECNATILLNATAGAANPQGIDSANISRGNNSIGAGKNFHINESGIESGQEALYVCLRTVPTEIATQAYDTSGTSTAVWTVTIA